MKEAEKEGEKKEGEKRRFTEDTEDTEDTEIRENKENAYRSNPIYVSSVSSVSSVNPLSPLPISSPSLLSSSFPADPLSLGIEDYPDVPPWSLREALAREKESIGFYLSGHPTACYGIDLSRLLVVPIGLLPRLEPWSRVRICGMVEGYQEKVFKQSGGKAAFFVLEDDAARIEVKVRQQQMEDSFQALTSKEPVVLLGRLCFPRELEDPGLGQGDGHASDVVAQDPTFVLEQAQLLSEVVRKEARRVAIRVLRKQLEKCKDKLYAALKKHPGPCLVQIVEHYDGKDAVTDLPDEYRVEPSESLLGAVEEALEP